MRESFNIDTEKWRNSSRTDYSSLHQLAPYIGKMKPIMAKELIRSFTDEGDLICDPFVGSGTVALEAVIEQRKVICNDINPYAFTLTKAKINPIKSFNKATEKVEDYLKEATSKNFEEKISNTPQWVKDFFHPKTLKETISFAEILKENEEYFLLSCLLGILHHQRPGFLSYPASNLVPYLKTDKFPKEEYPERYEYRDVKSRMISKLKRVYRRFPKKNFNLRRECFLKSAAELDDIHVKIDAVITSPPYMNNLDYARDNRLRLWFLDVFDYKPLDKSIRNEELFIDLMIKSLRKLKPKIKKDGRIILVLGNKNKKEKVVDLVLEIMNDEIRGFELMGKVDDRIPDIRRSRKNKSGTKKEWILVFKKK